MLVKKDNLELAGLSLAFFVDFNVDLTLRFVRLHGEHHSHGLEVLRAGSGLIDGLNPEGGVLLSLLLDHNGSMALLGGNAVMGVFKSDNRVALGFFRQAIEVRDLGLESGSSAEGHSFNRVLSLENLEKLIDLDVVKILDVEAGLEVLLDTANVFGGARVVGYRI